MTHDELDSLRARMDAINLEIRDRLQARARLVTAIAQWKRAHGQRIADPGREAAMLAQVLAGAGEGFPPAALQRIFAAVFAESRALAERAAT